MEEYGGEQIVIPMVEWAWKVVELGRQGMWRQDGLDRDLQLSKL